MKVFNTILKEEYIDDLKTGASKKYYGQPVYRVIGLIQENGRPQMYAIGLGRRDEEDMNYFVPAIRAARYTTEESMLFLSQERAKSFFKKFKSEYEGDFNLDEFKVTEYNPFNEITRLIPINTPYGAAFVGEQKVIKKSYEED